MGKPIISFLINFLNSIAGFKEGNSKEENLINREFDLLDFKGVVGN
jgi:hypothetical protein